jgi:hypothetical protein
VGIVSPWRLVGVKAIRAAVGTRVRLSVQTPDGPRELHRVVSSGGSFGSNPFLLEVGLGNATGVDSVEIRWPGSEKRQLLRDLELDRLYEIQEGGPAIQRPLRPFHLDQTRVSTPSGM